MKIQFDRARLISHRFNSAMVILSDLSFHDSTWPCSFNLPWIQFSRHHLTLPIVSIFNSTMLVYSHTNWIRSWSFNPINLFKIQFKCPSLIACGFNSAMIVSSCLSFQNSIWPCLFNLTQIQFGHDLLILSIFSRLNLSLLI